MDIRAVAFDANGTLVKILTEDGMDVAAIDLERMKRGDRMFDVGRVAGELRSSGISCGNTAVTSPMALNLLRIARNDYIDRDYGGRLIRQAKRLLHAA